MKRVAILGSGLLGCDLLVKCQKTKEVELVAFAGRDSFSKGLAFAKSRGVYTSDRSIEGIVEAKIKPDIIVDCTTASCHHSHDATCQANSIKIIDMTPAKIGAICCPAINLQQCLDANNINMISCGGQAALPLCFAIKSANPAIDYIEVVSTVASESVGPGTRKNISEYIASTQKAIEKMLAISKAKVIVNISPATPPVIMRTTIVIGSDSIANEAATIAMIEEMIERTSCYVHGYKSSIGLKKIGSRAICQVIVSGSGDYLPNYAGNLDIINCAALELIKSL